MHCREGLLQDIFGCLVDYKDDAGGDAGDGEDSSRDVDDDDDVDLVIAVDRLRGGAHFLILLQRSTPAPSD